MEAINLSSQPTVTSQAASICVGRFEVLRKADCFLTNQMGFIIQRMRLKKQCYATYLISFDSIKNENHQREVNFLSYMLICCLKNNSVKGHKGFFSGHCVRSPRGLFGFCMFVHHIGQNWSLQRNIYDLSNFLVAI